MWMPLIAALSTLTQVQTDERLDVLVLCGDAPVAGAEVRWYEGGPTRCDFGRLDELARASGHVVKTGADGRVQLAIPDSNVTLVASAPGAWACARPTRPSPLGGWCGLDPTPPKRPVGLRARSEAGAMSRALEATLRLEPDRDLVIDVVDAQGRALGDVPLVLASANAELSWGPGVMLATHSNSRTGRAVFRHAQFAVEGSEWARLLEEKGVWSVALESTAPSASPVVWRAAKMPTETQRLEVGARGEIEVDLLERDGSRTRGAKSVFLVERGRDPSARADSMRAVATWGGPTYGSMIETLPAGVMRTMASDGRALFRCVDLGRELLVCSRSNEASAWTTVELRSPTRAGERATASLTLGAGTISLRMRLVHDGTPLGAMTWDVAELGRVGGAPGDVDLLPLGQIESDADGVLCLDFAPQVGADLRVRIATPQGVDLPHEFALEPGRHAPGWTDLGLVEVPLAPLAVRGTVLDDLGTPVPDARVVVMPVAEFDSMLRGLEPGSDERYTGAFHLRTDAAGHFRVFTAFCANFSAASGARNALTAVRNSIAHGTADVRLDLLRFAGARGRVSFEDGHATSGVTLRMLRIVDGPSPELAPSSGARCTRDGRFEFPDLVAGKYRLTVMTAFGGEPFVPVFTRDGIVVAGGQTTDLGEIVIR